MHVTNGGVVLSTCALSCCQFENSMWNRPGPRIVGSTVELEMHFVVLRLNETHLYDARWNDWLP
jgi:hypothetical protein